MQVFVLAWHFVLARHKKKRRRDISRYVVIQRRKGKKYQAATERDAYAHSHFVQESKEERETERETERKNITNETDIAGT